MALKKTQIAVIAELLKVKPAEIEAALAATDEVELPIPEKLVTFDEAQLTSRDSVKYKEGKTAGEEMTAKALKKLAAGEEVDADSIGAKTITAIKSNMEIIGTKAVETAKLPPNDQIKEKETVIQGLRDKLQIAEGLVTTEKANTIKAENKAKMLGFLPINRDPRFSDEEYLVILEGEYELADDNGVSVLKSKKNGEIVKNDKDLKAVEPKEAIAKHFETKKWIAEGTGAGGRGGGNSAPAGGAGAAKMSDLRKKAEAEGISIQGEKFDAMVKEAQKENPNLVMD